MDRSAPEARAIELTAQEGTKRCGVVFIAQPGLEEDAEIYDCMTDPDSGRYLSEDYAFCRLWRDIGGSIWVDLECKLNHLGQHMFRGDLAESLRVQNRW